MMTGTLKSQIDRIWDAFWSGGISNPMEVIEQMTYLLFIKRLDEEQTRREKRQPVPRARLRIRFSTSASRSCAGRSSRNWVIRPSSIGSSPRTCFPSSRPLAAMAVNPPMRGT